MKAKYNNVKIDLPLEVNISTNNYYSMYTTKDTNLLS